MRTLEINKTKLWYVNIVSITDKIDGDGFFTGEKINTYGTPAIIYLPLYPANGRVSEQIFGKDAQLDMVAVSNNVELNKDTLLFLSAPTTTSYDTTYDYNINSIAISLNTFNYGLKKRV